MEKKTWLSIREITLVALFAALTAVGAFIRIPLPFVPLTLQVFFIFLAGDLLGSRLGALSQLIYVGIGLLGIPVLTGGGGPAYVLQPTFGYLIGFIFSAYIIGKILEAVPRPVFPHYLSANLVGLLVTYFCGVLYLYLNVNFLMDKPLTFWAALKTGAILPLPGDLLKAFLAASLSTQLAKALPRRGV